MVTTLYLIRHGETKGDGAKRYHGSIDVPLSLKGENQMQATAGFVKTDAQTAALGQQASYLRDIHSKPAVNGETGPVISACRESLGEERLQASRNDKQYEDRGLAAVCCSDLSRAIRSAEFVGAPFGLLPVIVPDLRERSFGIWEGMTFLDIKAGYPREFEAWAENPLQFSPPQGESTLKVRDRVIPAVEKILADHQGERIAIVAHGGVNRIILCHITGIPLENIFRIEQDHAAVNIIEFWEKYPIVKLLNGKAY